MSDFKRTSKILVLGQNPATESNLETPFVGTKSYNTIESWFNLAGLDLKRIILKNATTSVSKLSLKNKIDLHELLLTNPDVVGIITLGRVAENLVKNLDSDILTLNLPHPSGLNRTLNDPKVRLNIIKDIRNFLNVLIDRDLFLF